MSVTDAESALTRVRAELSQEPGTRLAVLFGSAAKGHLHAQSDLDVAILPAETPMGQALAYDDLALQARLTLAAGREVDLVRLDQASTLLGWQIAKTGVALHEAHPGELARWRARATADYIDFRPSFERYGELFRKRLAKEGQVA